MNSFMPLYPSIDPENQNFEKMEKTLEDIILQMFPINDSNMIYDHFGPFFALLPP